jgi:hypothetical protein
MNDMLFRFLFTIVFILNTYITFGQQVINTRPTPEHLSVSGTKVSLVPPNGFEKAANFAGFQQTQSGASIMVMSIPGPAEKIQAGLTREAFLSQGVEISDIEKLTLNGLPAVLLTGTQKAY